jgi:hypothetical protein
MLIIHNITSHHLLHGSMGVTTIEAMDQNEKEEGVDCPAW